MNHNAAGDIFYFLGVNVRLHLSFRREKALNHIHQVAAGLLFIRQVAVAVHLFWSILLDNVQQSHRGAQGAAQHSRRRHTGLGQA